MSKNSEANGSALAAAVNKCAEIGASKLSIKKGVYKFFEENAPVIFKEMKDFVFDANGSTFIFRRNTPNESFNINGCERCVFKNFRVDWDWKTQPLAAIVKITDAGKSPRSGDFYDVEFVEFKGDVYPMYGKPVSIKGLFSYDMKASVVGVEEGSESYYGYTDRTVSPPIPNGSTGIICAFTLRLHS